MIEYFFMSFEKAIVKYQKEQLDKDKIRHKKDHGLSRCDLFENTGEAGRRIREEQEQEKDKVIFNNNDLCFHFL